VVGASGLRPLESSTGAVIEQATPGDRLPAATEAPCCTGSKTAWGPAPPTGSPTSATGPSQVRPWYTAPLGRRVPHRHRDTLLLPGGVHLSNSGAPPRRPVPSSACPVGGAPLSTCPSALRLCALPRNIGRCELAPERTNPCAILLIRAPSKSSANYHLYPIPLERVQEKALSRRSWSCTRRLR